MDETILTIIICVCGFFTIIKMLKSIDKEMNDLKIHCSCYFDREDLNIQKEKYFASKNQCDIKKD